MSVIRTEATECLGKRFDALSGNKSPIELGRDLAPGTFNGTMRMVQRGRFEHGFF